MTTLFGRRVLLRPLVLSDFPAWQEVRRRNVDWLTKWEAQRVAGQPDVVEDRDAYSVRCSARQRTDLLATRIGLPAARRTRSAASRFPKSSSPK